LSSEPDGFKYTESAIDYLRLQKSWPTVAGRDIGRGGAEGGLNIENDSYTVMPEVKQ
jgi:hypothetical protein